MKADEYVDLHLGKPFEFLVSPEEDVIKEIILRGFEFHVEKFLYVTPNVHRFIDGNGNGNGAGIFREPIDFQYHPWSHGYGVSRGNSLFLTVGESHLFENQRENFWIHNSFFGHLSSHKITES